MNRYVSLIRVTRPLGRILLSCMMLLACAEAWAARDPSSVTVGAQSGTPTYGTSSAATYTVTFGSTGAGNGTCVASITGLPAGVTAAFSGGTTVDFSNGTPSPSKTLTLTTNAATTPAVTADVFTVTCTDGGFAPSDSGTLTVNRKALTVTASDQSKTYGTVFPFAGTEFTTAGLVNGDTVTSATITSATGAPATATVAGSPYAIAISAAAGSGLANYTITYVSGQLTVNARPITITADAKSKNVGAADPALTYTITSGSLANSDTLNGALTRVAGETAGTYAILQGTLALAANASSYTLTYISANLTINNLLPTTTSISPNSAVIGSAGFTMTVNGTNFVASSVVRFAGVDRATTFVSATQLTAIILAADLTVAGAYNITVFNPAPGGGLSNAQIFTVANVPASFNAFETGTAAAAITGKIYTKLAGTAFSLDVVAIHSAAQMSGFSGTVTVELLGNQSTGVALDGQNCPTSSTTIQTVSPNPSIVSGRSTVNFAAVANAWKDVRVRIRYPTGSPTVTTCSSDNFSIRPTGMAVTSTDATNNNTSGTPAIKTGTNFNLTATAIAGYNGTPSIDNTAGKIVGTPTAGTLGGSFAAANPATGAATGTVFYNEVGNLGLGAHAIYDSTFTSVDLSGTDCTADFSNTLVGGRYGCSFGSAAVAQTTGSSGFGRFIPDNFNVTYNTPVLGPACGTFSYVGQVFSYTTAPVMTVTARSGTSNGLTNTTTVNYAGSYAKFSNAAGISLNQAPYNVQSGRYARFDALGGGLTPALNVSGLPVTTADPTIGAFVAGVGAFTFGSGTGLLFTRSATTPNAPFNADIALALNVVDTDAVAFGSNPAAFGAATSGNGIGFTGGNKTMRFGRLQLSNVHGSELLKLRVPVEAQYWNGAAFVTNSADSCTTLAAANVTMDDYKNNLLACETGISVATALSAGSGVLQLSAPGSGNTGSVRLRLNLGAASGNTCLAAGGPQSAATSAAAAYLQVKSGANYDADPAVRATFGVRRAGPVIYLREMY